MIKSGRLKATKLSPRNTRIYRSDFEDFFKSEPPAVVPNLRNEKAKEETILTRENCFSVSEVVTLFGQERGNVYSILSRENVPKIKIGKEAFYSINEVNRVYKKLQKPRPLGLEEVRKANRRKSDKPLEKKDCYSIKRCEQLLNKDRSNLYSLFKRRGIPKLRIGQEAYYAKSGVDKIVRSLKEKEEM
jgi:predicted DNA-binding transcriptional regulator AlpA